MSLASSDVKVGHDGAHLSAASANSKKHGRVSSTRSFCTQLSYVFAFAPRRPVTLKIAGFALQVEPHVLQSRSGFKRS